MGKLLAVTLHQPFGPMILRHSLAALSALCVLLTIPWRICARRAGPMYRGDIEAERSLAAGARVWLEQNPRDLSFHTGSARFDGEWFLIVHMTAALGFAQTSIEHPELSHENGPWAKLAAERTLLPEARQHDRVAWNEDSLESLDRSGSGHLAHLGYANLALSMLASTPGMDSLRPINEAITDALARRYAASSTGILESYPGEAYPADNAVALASILLFDRRLGRDHRAAAEHGLSALATFASDPRSGLLYQRVDARTGAPLDAARASGTAMAAFALGYADQRLAERLYRPLARQAERWIGFGGIREYPRGFDSHGDIDSGPLILGLSVSATGFALASARRLGDETGFRSLFASVWLFGLPVERAGSTHFATGGALGDVLLFALLTAGAPA